MTDAENTGLPLANEDLSKIGVGGSSEAQFAEAAAIAERVGHELAANFRTLPPRQRRSVVTAFRRALLPPGRPGRRRSKEITAAYADWTSGVRGLELYRRHIHRFDRMGHWERNVRMRALMDAIRARKRREQRQRTSAAECPNDQTAAPLRATQA